VASVCQRPGNRCGLALGLEVLEQIAGVGGEGGGIRARIFSQEPEARAHIDDLASLKVGA
jgi:hypothetical protein